MKKLILSILLLQSFLAFGQRDSSAHLKSSGYGYLTMGGFLMKSGSVIYPSLGFGVRKDVAGIGAVFYYNKDYQLSMHADMRFFLSPNRNTSPFISLQPGAVIYNKSTQIGGIKIITKGGFAFNALAGFMSAGKKHLPGIYFAIGYGVYNISTSYGTNYSRYKNEGAIISVGIKI